MATCFSPLSTAPPRSLEWGAATSAYQIEGAIKAGGRGEDIWTPWVHKPFHILDGSNGESLKAKFVTFQRLVLAKVSCCCHNMTLLAHTDMYQK
jgi:hypothetical protein